MIFYCPQCGAELQEDRRVQTCSYCGAVEECDWLCPQGHFVCEECRTAQPAEIIERVCRGTTSLDPIWMANLIMKHPLFSACGPEHHVLVAPVILAALRNHGHPVKEGAVRAALRRMRDIPVGVCGTRGDCGACVGLGCAISLLTAATYESDRERSLSLKGTARALACVAELGGPRCCKQSVYATLQTARAYVSSELGVAFSLPDVILCPFSRSIEECKKERCAYFPAE
jgi:hypothetical protein